MTAAPEYRITALRMGTLTVDSTVLVMGHGAGATIEIGGSAGHAARLARRRKRLDPARPAQLRPRPDGA
jgi:hypothetical protein